MNITSGISKFFENAIAMLAPNIALAVKLGGAEIVTKPVNSQVQAFFTIPEDVHDRLMSSLPTKELKELAEQKRHLLADTAADYTILATCAQFGIMPDTDKNEASPRKPAKAKDAAETKP